MASGHSAKRTDALDLQGALGDHGNIAKGLFRQGHRPVHWLGYCLE